MAFAHFHLRGVVSLAVVLALLGVTTDSMASLRVSVTHDDEGLTLNWSGLPEGYHYTVQWRESLESGQWQNAPGEEPWPITALEWKHARPLIGTSRFYRVMAVPLPAERGQVISSTLIQTWTAGLINFLAAQQGIPLSAQYDVTVYKVVYETIDPGGLRTHASGAVALPQNPAGAIPLLSYQHGTVLRKADVPSNESSEALAGVLLASTGYAAALADYLGLGDSPGFHPYHHARSQATACVDMLRAAGSVSAEHAVALNGQLFLAGYSQGGHATLALHRELEAYHAGEFSVTASAPMAGAYDLSGVVTEDFLSDRAMPQPYYFAYLLEAYRQVYGLADSLAELLAPPYDVNLPPLLDGLHSGSEVNSVLPSRPVQILRPEYLETFVSDPNHPLRVALRENDVHEWTPAAPVRLYHCSGDEDVLFANSEAARDSFHSRGATDVVLIEPDPGADHGGCVLPSLMAAKAWFDSLRE